MNILKRELRAGIKPFLLWSLGLFVLVFAGMIKFTGFNTAEGGANITEILDAFPRVALAVLGIVGFDVSSLGGYYALLIYYANICAAIYAVSLGIRAVNREIIDKTYEFVFTKPRTRSFILQMKLLSALIYLTAFGILNYVFSVAAISTLSLDEHIDKQVVLFTITIYIISILFCTLAGFIASAARRAEKGALYGNLSLLAAIVIGVIYDMLENGGVLRFITPFKYFAPIDLIEGNLDPLYVVICLCASMVFYFGALALFQKKEFQA